MRAVDRTGIEVIDRDECLRLVAARRVGRLGIVAGGEPLILPVNDAVVDEALVFRAAPGTKRDLGPRAPACFEVDDFDEAMRSDGACSSPAVWRRSTRTRPAAEASPHGRPGRGTTGCASSPAASPAGGFGRREPEGAAHLDVVVPGVDVDGQGAVEGNPPHALRLGVENLPDRLSP